jgi:hypothetical protein
MTNKRCEKTKYAQSPKRPQRGRREAQERCAPEVCVSFLSFGDELSSTRERAICCFEVVADGSPGVGPIFPRFSQVQPGFGDDRLGARVRHPIGCPHVRHR